MATGRTGGMVDQSRVTVRVSRRFSASPERVFDAWLNVRSIGKWLFATPAGQMVRAEVEPKVGGRFVLTDRRDGVDVDHVGEYLEIDRPRRLVFSFSVPTYSAEATCVTVEITPAGDGCELVLTHEGVLADYGDRTTGGWTGVLEGLAASLD
jgi:uncharacterized protein YndB with AHSA1/START domain